MYGRRLAARVGVIIGDAPDLLDRLADRVADRLRDGGPPHYLRPKLAAQYIGANVQRMHELKCMGVITPDGFDGRIPLYTRDTLDAYVRRGRR